MNCYEKGGREMKDILEQIVKSSCKIDNTVTIM